MDKRITRLANSGVTSVTMFGKHWPLSPGTWAVKVPRKLGRPRMRLHQTPYGVPDVSFVAGRMVPDFANAKLVKLDDDRYLPPAMSGGMCIRRDDYLSTRMLRGLR